LRTLMFRLHPPGLDDEGLAAALDELLTDTFDGTEMVIDLDVDQVTADRSSADHLSVDRPDASASPAEAQEATADTTTVTLVFRIAAEAIRNVRKHAGASRIEVNVSDTGDGVQLAVIDDGIGSETDEVSDGPHGITISRALATAAGGWWQISSRPGHGTTVTCWLPHPKDRRRA
jgi:signal transduction histidine kinase